LFVCTGNRARSQMAEGILRHLAGDRFEVFSAGTEPKGLASATVNVMREVGIDVASHRSKSIQEFVGIKLDYVITLCNAARASCSRLGRVAHYRHWDISDPADLEREGADRIEAFRTARDQLRSRIEGFIRVATG